MSTPEENGHSPTIEELEEFFSNSEITKNVPSSKAPDFDPSQFANPIRGERIFGAAAVNAVDPETALRRGGLPEQAAS